MFLNREIKIATVLLLSTFVVSCAGTMGPGVSEKNRDTTGTFDGIWTVDVQKAAGTQYYGKWHVSCGDMRRSFNMRVNDGTMTLSDAADAKKAFVSAGGVFKITLPMSDDAQASGNSSSTISNGDMQMILTGTLAASDGNSKGYITYGIAEMGYAGCTAKTKFKLTNPSNKGEQT